MNYQKKLDELLEMILEEEQVPSLLLHSCCAPCSSYVLEYLSNYFRITIFYYNPNIFPETEYMHRVKEQQELIQKIPHKYPIEFKEGIYNTSDFYAMAKGLEEEKEGGERCKRCYRMRLEQTAMIASQGDYNYFTTTLSISPYKNAKWLNDIGNELKERYGVDYLTSDFKKKNGYKRSIELSKDLDMYRQDYCGCIFSKREMEEKHKNKIEA